MIEFGELPQDGRYTNTIEHRPGDGLGPEAIALWSNPGQWARIAVKETRDSAAGVAFRIREGKGSFSSGGYEAVTRGCDVWARFVETPCDIS